MSSDQPADPVPPAFSIPDGRFMAGQQPTRARLVLVLFLCTMAFVLYLDRVCISQAASSIMADLEFSNSQMSWVLASFTLAYGLFEIPTGAWGDRYGSRRILTRIVVWWSAFTALTAVCFGLYSLMFVRFLFGAGEAGAYPNAARVITRWFPPAERGRVQGLFMAASLLGGAFSPFVASPLIKFFGWRWAFLAFGGLGVLWAVLFYLWFRDDPSEHAGVNAEELAHINSGGPIPTKVHAPIPWRAVFHNRSIWLLGAAVSCTAFNSYFYFSWYPTYLKSARGVEEVASGAMAGMVLGFAAAGNLLGGFLGDSLKRRFSSLVLVRRVLVSSCMLVAALLLVLSVHTNRPWMASSVAAASSFILFLQQSTWWSSVVEVSGRHVGSLFGLMNGMGIFGAMGSQFFFGYFADWQAARGLTGRAQYDPAFYVFAAVLLLGALFWQFIDSSRAVRDDEPSAV